MITNDRADTYQVGSTHYKTEYEHWNWVITCGLGYLEGCATKYLTRWRKTVTGPNDLRKSLHYVNKLIESVAQYSVARRNLRLVRQETMTFVQSNKLSPHESRVILQLATWEILTDLLAARNTILLIMDEAGIELDPPKTVPVTDSNKHAPRVIGDVGEAIAKS